MPDAPTVTDPHDELTCRARDMLDRVAGKWSLSVIHELAWGPRRFMELKGRLAGVSQRMLTATLRGLERDGLVRRTVHPVVPPRVDYELTALGVSLLDTVCQLMAWTVDHMPDIERARADFDATGKSHDATSEPRNGAPKPPDATSKPHDATSKPPGAASDPQPARGNPPRAVTR